MLNHRDGWLFTSAEDCCRAHYMWDVQECRRNSIGQPKWYPDFDSGGGCKNDGIEPLFMRRYDDYLFDSLEECCQNHYFWNVEGCTNPALAPDPCEYTFMDIYDENFLLADSAEIGYYPVCKYHILTCTFKVVSFSDHFCPHQRKQLMMRAYIVSTTVMHLHI